MTKSSGHGRAPEAAAGRELTPDEDESAASPGAADQDATFGPSVGGAAGLAGSVSTNPPIEAVWDSVAAVADAEGRLVCRIEDLAVAAGVTGRDALLSLCELGRLNLLTWRPDERGPGVVVTLGGVR